jgi:nucleotide-binding universal stress UspA family protein
LLGKVLVPLDGSEHADKALDCALDLAETYSAEIILLSVIHVSPIAPIAPPLGIPTSSLINIRNYEKEIEDNLKRVLSEAVEKTKKTKPYLKVTTKLVEGRPADKIVETAKEEKVDIIVMGHRGVSGIKKLFLGSVSKQVVDEAPCPVLIIK